jgi:hypothetical protein
MDDPSSDGELPPMIRLQHEEFKMPDPDAITRTTVYCKDVKGLAEVMKLPLDMDPSKIVRLTTEFIRNGGQTKMTKAALWDLVDRFYQDERA